MNASGYGLTFGLHTRIDETIAAVLDHAGAGNLYVNRNIIGAVVGSQPFGGHGLSGTGPKAGGPLYLHRLVRGARAEAPTDLLLPGPVGEENRYRTAPRAAVLCIARTPAGLSRQIDAALAASVRAVVDPTSPAGPVAGADPARVSVARDRAAASVEAALVEAPGDPALLAELAARPGAVIPVYLTDADHVPAIALVREQTTSLNTAAAGGNASLMAIG